MAAIGDRYISEVYELSVTPSGSQTYTVRTVRSEGDVNVKGMTAAFDSESPKESDPWPIALQMAISATPANIQFDISGFPTGLMNVQAWKDLAWQRIQTLGLPDNARPSAEALLDPSGVVENLRRDFQGTPTGEDWNRPVVIAGIRLDVQSRCAQTTLDKQQAWACTGSAERGQSARGGVFDLKTQTHVIFDRLGLMEMTFQYDAVLVRADASGALSHHAVGGKRKVIRMNLRSKSKSPKDEAPPP